MALETLYLDKKNSLSDVAKILNISVHKVVYWMSQYQIPRRRQSEANYLKHNPKGDPFEIKSVLSLQEEKLKSLALGIYWGEGSKADDHVVKVANTDTVLVRLFRDFLTRICGVLPEKIHYYLQLFKDNPLFESKRYWATQLRIDENRILVSNSLPSLGTGSYRRINNHGVMSICFFNTKLKAYVLGELGALGYVGNYSTKIEARKMVK